MKLKLFRKDNEITQQDLRKTLTKNGYDCGQQLISKVESGLITPSEGFIDAFEKAYPGVAIDEFQEPKSVFKENKRLVDIFENADLKKFRNEYNLTQDDFIEMLNDYGYVCTQQSISKIELGILAPPLEFLRVFENLKNTIEKDWESSGKEKEAIKEKLRLQLKSVELKNFRANNHLSQIALLKTLKSHGWNGYLLYLKNIESGEKDPSMDFIEAFVKAYPDAKIDQALINKLK